MHATQIAWHSKIEGWFSKAISEIEQKNIMQQHKQTMKTTEDEISLFEISKFLGDNWKLILGIGLAGVVASGGFLAVASSQYAATALVEMAQVPNSNITQTTSIEVPALLVERLKSPSTYTPEAIRTCGLDGVAASVEAMTRIVETTLPKNLGSIAQITVRRDSPELAKQCVGAVFEMVRGQQMELGKPYYDELKTILIGLQSRLRENQDYVAKAEKAGLYQTMYMARRDESIYLTQQINELQRTLSRNTQTRLVSPIYASPNKVYPKRALTLVLGTMAGLMLGLLLAIGRTMLKKWYGNIGIR